MLCLAAALLLLTLTAVCAEAAAVQAGHSEADPGFTSYVKESATKDWCVGEDGYYYLQNDLARYLIGTARTYQKKPTDYTPEQTGSNAQGSMVKGTVMDAVPAVNQIETLDWTQFVLRGGKVNRTWYYTPSMQLEFSDIHVNDDGSISASGAWDNNANVTAEITYTLIENTPLLKMELTIHNGMKSKLWANLGFLIDPEGEQDTYVPGSLGWRTGEWKNPDWTGTAGGGLEGEWQTPTTGWDDNFLFMGKKEGYSGKPAHAILWSPQNTVYSLIPKNDYTGIWIPASTDAGKSKTITLYYMTHIPGADGEAYSVAKLWADALENGKLDDYRAVSGHVRTADGTAVSNALVSFRSGEQVFRGMSDANGLFQIYVEKNAQYALSVSGDGIATLRRSFEMGADAAELELTVRPGSGEEQTELPSDDSAEAGILTQAPEYTHASERCEDEQAGDVLLENAELSAVVDAKTGALKSIVPLQTRNDSVSGAELVLQQKADKNATHSGSGFKVTSVSAQDGMAVLTANAEGAEGVTAQITYAPVENAPLMKIKMTLTNHSDSDYSGALGYLFDPEENGEQTYLPGTGWIGGGPGEYASALKSGSGTQNYVYNGSLGMRTQNTAHALMWPGYYGSTYLPSNVLFHGGRMGVWYDVSLAAGQSREILLYHYVEPQGDPTDPMCGTRLWAEAVNGYLTLDEIGTISGSAADGVRVVAEKYSTAALADGTYRLFVPAGVSYDVYASNGTEESEHKTASAGDRVDFTLTATNGQTKVGMTYGDPRLTYGPDSGLRDWWPVNPYYFLENELVKLSIYPKRTSKLVYNRPSEDASVWSGNNSGNGKWGALNAGTIADAVSLQNRTENLDWSEFVLFPDRPAEGAADYYDRRYLGVTDEDEQQDMFMEWSWWFAVNKLEMPSIQTDADSLTASGAWEGGTDERKDILSSVRYSLVDNSPLVRMDITLQNTGAADFSGSLAFVLDPDLSSESQSYVPGVGWTYTQAKKRITSGWTDNYIFDGINGYTGNTAHAILWPDAQQPEMIFSEAGWISAWFHVSIAQGGEDTLTIYYLPHTPGGADAPYSVAEYWAGFLAKDGDAASQGVVTGTVTNASGEALSGAAVTLLRDGEAAQSVVTDTDGRYTLFASAGSWTISVEAENYAPAARDVELDGGDHLIEDFRMVRYVEIRADFPEQIRRGDVFEFTVTVTNTYGAALDGLKAGFGVPATMELLSWEKDAFSLKDGESTTLRVRALALSGGRRALELQIRQGGTLCTAEKYDVDISGAGYYSGDPHSHSVYSDGTDTLEENAAAAYGTKQASWVWATEHNNAAQSADTQAITQSYGGSFLHLSGTELTTGYTHNPSTPSGQARGHALVYGYDGVPRLIIDQKGGEYDWQACIDELTGSGALMYLAHPFDSSYPFEDAYAWSGYTGVEVWNGSVHASHENSRKAFRLWDQKNMEGTQRYYGTAGTDAHSSEKVAGLGLCGYLEELSSDELMHMLRSGGFYGSNGPELRFSVGGTAMGSQLTLAQAGEVRIDFEAYTQTGTLTSIRILGFPITGSIEDYDEAAAVLLELDLSGEETAYYSGSVTAEVTKDCFYRMEVKSTDPMPGSATGAGPEAGKGFAFSNPVWVTLGESDTRCDIRAIRYHGAAMKPVQERFGVQSLTLEGAFKPQALVFDAGEANVEVSCQQITDSLYLADVIVSAGDNKNVQTYLIRMTQKQPEQTPIIVKTGGASAAPSRKTLPFTDVPETAWYYESVKSAWENGLINGVTAERFMPEQTLTVAQAIKLAAALHQLRTEGSVTLRSGSAPWYGAYVRYAVEHEIIQASYLDYSEAQMNVAASRAEFAHIFFGAMRHEGYPEINRIADGAIPDLPVGASYADEIYTLYRAGILTGSDAQGTFRPDSSISRAEAAAILARMYTPELRKTFTLK